MTDAETTAEIYRLLRERYGDHYRYACAREVGEQTGLARRRLDFVVVNCWSSDGKRIEAFEVKASKSDLRHDLENPEKHNIFFDDIDTYTLVAPAEVIDTKVIPPKWGILALQNGKLVVRRKPIALHDDRRRDIGRNFVLSFVRAVTRQNSNATEDDLNAAERAAMKKGEELGRVWAEREIGQLKGQLASMQWYADFVHGMGISWKPSDIRKSAREYALAMNFWAKLKDVPQQLDYLKSQIEKAYAAKDALVAFLAQFEADAERKDLGTTDAPVVFDRPEGKGVAE